MAAREGVWVEHVSKIHFYFVTLLHEESSSIMRFDGTWMDVSSNSESRYFQKEHRGFV